ncbi:MAG: peptidylprolyl isomerase [Flavobacteriaceae bacterium]|jgi:peptidyl-prolyl cis-trans isomerase SurA|nr:peptidylprolyl isomerase [Formosa sp.]MDG1375292.1 peptidylprolyl isomerase [Flavobacteriaceae bacterium]MDG2498338.1 peptidylprolyl isomerase [Flavobacteriaceae bacterium]
MQLKIKNLKFITKYYVLGFCLLISLSSFSQEIIEETVEVEAPKETVNDTVQRVKLDGVAAVIGDFVILDSDIDRQFTQLEAGGISTEDITRCQLFGKLLEDKLYIHHAIQDSLEVNDAEVRSYVDQQLEGFAEQIGSMEKLIAYYKKSSEKELRDEMFELNKNGKMASMMQQSIVEEIEVTPDEVRQFFNKIAEDERPQFGTEMRVAQIVVVPETTQEEIDKVIKRLNEFRADVLDNGASFTTKAVLYTEDPGSKRTGGKFTLNRKRPLMVKEFREVAFSLQEGEVSKPFKTDFGYHIIQLEKIRGQEFDVRHILLIPKVTQAAIKEAKEKLEKVRQSIVDGEITFAEAAIEASDEEETKFDGGQLRNPETQDYNFELTKMDPELYSQIQNLKDNEVSPVLKDQDRVHPIKFKILTVTARVDEHEANFAQDYLKIKALALQEKQLNAIEKWQEEKIMDTYIKINGELRSCDFNSNWFKIN